jgi:PleD family two-component response regulator
MLSARAPRTKILIAVTLPVRYRMERVLDGHDLVFVDSVSEAMSQLTTDGFGMVVLSVHFDESQMFSLLGDIRAHAKYRKVPILCVLGPRGRALSEIAIEGLDHAVKAMTANGFLDLQRFADDEEGNARIRRIIDYLVLIDGDLQNFGRPDTAKPEVVVLDENKRARG